MDLLTELESMAANIVDELESETIEKWQRLFHYTQAEATEHIKNHRGNLSRVRISDEHWEIVRSEEETRGYDREAYEYFMNLGKIKKPLATRSSESREPSTFLLRL